jgi:protein-disulfide isomerase
VPIFQEISSMLPRRATLFLLAGALAMPAFAAPPTKPNWAATVVTTPEGGIRIGNPAAKVKIVEFASFTCPHCKDFHEIGVPALKARYIANGSVSIEMRSFMRNGPDFSASLLVACQPGAKGLAMADALFAEQGKWTQGFGAISAADGDAIARLPLDQQPLGMAKASGLDKWAVAKGLPLARAQACLADKNAQNRLVAIYKDALDTWKLEGTPTFVINGKTVTGVYDWANLEPKVQAALR